MRRTPPSTGRLGPVLADAAEHLAAQAGGSVVELGLALERRYPPSVSMVRRLDGPADRWCSAPVDTVVSVAALWRPEWDEAALDALVHRLASGGRVLFAEPVAVVGVSGAVQRMADPLLRWREGLSFVRDVPGELRTAGLVTTAVCRTTVDRRGRVRTVAVGVAVRR